MKNKTGSNCVSPACRLLFVFLGGMVAELRTGARSAVVRVSDLEPNDRKVGLGSCLGYSSDFFYCRSTLFMTKYTCE